MANRNVVVALLVAPLLSLLAWWAVGAFTGEQPGPARAGASYPLLEKSGCRYAGGACVLENVDFSLELDYLRDGDRHFLEVHASHSLEGMLAMVGPPQDDGQPRPMTRGDSAGRYWRLALVSPPQPMDTIRLLANASGSTWFGEAATVFTLPGERGRLSFSDSPDG